MPRVFLFLMILVPAAAQTRTLTVCEALRSAKDRERVTIRGEYWREIDWAGLIEPGLDGAACPGFGNWWSTPPSTLFPYFAPWFGVPAEVDWKENLRKLPLRGVVTVSGVFIRGKWWWWALIHQRSDGSFGTIGFLDRVADAGHEWYGPAIVITSVIDR